MIRLLPILCCLFIFIAEEGLAAEAAKNPPAVHLGKKSKTTMSGMAVNPLGGIPTITSDVTGMVLEAAVNEEIIDYYFVKGIGFSAGQEVLISLTITDPGPFTISSGAEYSKSMTIQIQTDPEGNFEHMIAVKYAPTDAGPHSATITHSADGAQNYLLSVDGNITTTPVEWLSFIAKVVNDAIVLDWVTASEKNNSHFEVEISKDPVAGFENIGQVNSKTENSRLPVSYRFEHYFRGSFNTFYFRLKQVDTDQAFSYSNVIAIEAPAAGGTKLVVMPNPVTATSWLSMTTAAAGKLNMVLFTLNGTEAYRKTYELETGSHIIALQINDQMPPGTYILNAEFEGQVHLLKLMKE